jgi:hypothetical protein
MQSSSDSGRDVRDIARAVPFDPAVDAVPSEVMQAASSDASVVVLLAAADDPDWAARAAMAIATEWAHDGQRIVLADLQLEEPRLHEFTGHENLDGLVDVFLYGASLARSAKLVRGRGFYLIPAGTYTPDVDDLYRHPRWKKLLAGFREANASLLLFVPADSPSLSALGSWVKDVIVLGSEPERVRDWLPVDWRIHGSLVPPGTAAPDPDDAEAPPAIGTRPAPVESGAEALEIRVEPVEGRVGRGMYPYGSKLPPVLASDEESDLTLPRTPVSRRRSTRWWVTPVLVLIVLVLVAAGLTFVAANRWPDLFRGWTTSPQPAAEPAPVMAVSRPAPVAHGELLPFAVQAKAFSTLAAAWEEAAAHAARIRGVRFYVSMQENQPVLYYNVLAGTLADTAEASALRARLVADGIIEAEDATGAWDLIQFVPYAFDLGPAETEAAASMRIDSLYARQIPAYAVAMPYSDDVTRWHVYAGAFRDSTNAEVMRELLVGNGLNASLVHRRGETAARR